MGVTVDTEAQHTNLTTLAALKRQIEPPDASKDELLADLIAEASDAIKAHCGRGFAREAVTETLPGYGGVYMTLARTPVVRVTSISLDGTAVNSTDYSIEDAEAGMMFKATRWAWTYQADQFLDAAVRPGMEEPDFSAVYLAGYLVPEDDLITSAVFASSSDNSFNLTDGKWPLLSSGEFVSAAGFSSTGLNAKLTVASRTDAKLTVSQALVSTSSNSDLKTFRVSTLPRDIEKACVETAKSWYLERKNSAAVAQKTVGDLTIRYREPQAGELSSLPFTARALLGPYVRRW